MEDVSGNLIIELMRDHGYNVVQYEIVPDEADIISNVLKKWADIDKLDLIVTTGATSLTVRDIMPEATTAVLDKQIPGIAEAMRIEGMKFTPMAMLSRGVAGIRGSTLILNLPGSPNAVKENLGAVLSVLQHAIEMIQNDVHQHPSNS
tara:strand:- start:495 stop:938 length:444 start_codon:yes stop_codon:yes gene_type:complete